MDIIKPISYYNNKIDSIFSEIEIKNFERIMDFITKNYDKIHYNLDFVKYYINPLFSKFEEKEKKVKIIYKYPQYNDFYLYNTEFQYILKKYNIQIYYYHIHNNKIIIKFDLPFCIVKFSIKKSKSTNILYLKMKIKSLSEYNIENLNIYDNLYYTHSISNNNINIYSCKMLFNIMNIKNINNIIIYFIYIFLSIISN